MCFDLTDKVYQVLKVSLYILTLIGGYILIMAEKKKNLNLMIKDNLQTTRYEPVNLVFVGTGGNGKSSLIQLLLMTDEVGEISPTNIGTTEMKLVQGDIILKEQKVHLNCVDTVGFEYQRNKDGFKKLVLSMANDLPVHFSKLNCIVVVIGLKRFHEEDYNLLDFMEINFNKYSENMVVVVTSCPDKPEKREEELEKLKTKHTLLSDTKVKLIGINNVDLEMLLEEDVQKYMERKVVLREAVLNLLTSYASSNMSGKFVNCKDFCNDLVYNNSKKWYQYITG